MTADSGWERSGPRATHRALLAALAALTLTGVLLVTRQEPAAIRVDETVSQIARPPVRCARISVAVIEGFAYPPTLQRPTDGDPTTCFGDMAEARAAGYSLPPLGADVTAVGGLFLQPPDAYTASLCRRAAVSASAAVPCPSRLPAGGQSIGCTWCESQGWHLLHYTGFPFATPWCDRCRSQIVVAATPAGARGDRLDMTGCGPSGARRRVDATLLCRPDPPGQLHLHAGHALRTGHRDGWVYAVSANGHTRHARAVVDAVFETLRFVEP